MKGREAETVEPAIEEKRYYPEMPEEKDNREKFFEMADLQEGYMPELYATRKGLFLRRFVSEREGFQWFELTRDPETREWKAEAWEEAVPKTRQT